MNFLQNLRVPRKAAIGVSGLFALCKVASLTPSLLTYSCVLGIFIITVFGTVLQFILDKKG